MLTSKLRVPGVVRAAAGLFASEHGERHGVDAPAASGHGVYAVSFVSDLVTVVPVEGEAAL
jgi:hypothetical protein